MARPPKYATEAERRAARLAQKRRYQIKVRREARGLDPLAPMSGASGTGAKLTAEQVAEIRKLKAEQNYTLATLARQFGMSERAISEILREESWKDG